MNVRQMKGMMEMSLLARSLLVLASITLSVSRLVDEEEELVTLPFGEGLGDEIGPHAPEAVQAVNVNGKYIFYGREESRLFISENGVISFAEAFSDPFPTALPLTNRSGTSATPSMIAGFWGDIDVPKNGGAIFYIELSERNGERFACAKTEVLNLLREGFGGSLEDFHPSHIFLTTWEAVHENGPELFKRAVTFQIALVTDSTSTYTLLLYSDVRWNRSNDHGVLVGFNAGDGVRSFTHPLYESDRILDLDLNTNARSLGAYMYRVDGDEIIEPTRAQRREDICVMTFNESREQQYQCDCPTEERPILAFNQINCLQKPLAVMFVNNTPSVSEGTITAHFITNRPHALISCHLPRTNRGTREDCSSGMFRHSGLLPGRYSLRIIARDPLTEDRVILRGYFTVSQDQSQPDKNTCGVTIINTGTEVQSGTYEVNFTRTGATSQFLCRVDRERRRACESPFTVKNLSPGSHRVVVIPAGAQCNRNNTNSASIRFTVRE